MVTKRFEMRFEYMIVPPFKVVGCSSEARESAASNKQTMEAKASFIRDAINEKRERCVCVEWWATG